MEINYAYVSVWLLRGRLGLLCPDSRALRCIKHDVGHCAPYTLNFQEFMLQEISEFLYVGC